MFHGFADGNCDNILHENDFILINEGTIDANGEIWDLKDYGDIFVPGDLTVCFGVAWRLPETVGNDVQTDSMSATIEFQVEQKRNNPTPFTL